MKNEIDSDYIKYCRGVARRTGPNYYFATRYYPKEIREATWCFYAFVRESDQIVDGNLYATNQEKIDALGKWASNWEQAYKLGKSPHVSQLAAAAVFRKYKIPYQYSLDFLTAMADDISIDSYQTYEDLRTYMYGSAGVIGAIMSYIVGFEGGEETLSQAVLMGEAMQMANFIRDVGEDYISLSRVYLPIEDLKRFNVTKQDIANQEYSDNFIKLIKFEIERTKDLYRESIPYLEKLNPDARFPILLACLIYIEVLNYIENHNYQVLSMKKLQPGLLGKIACELKLKRLPKAQMVEYVISRL